MVAYNKLRRATYYSNPEASKEYTKKFLNYARKRNDSLHIAFAHFYLGNSYVQSNNLNLAITEYIKSSNYYERVNDTKRLPSIYNAIGAVYEKKQQDSLSLIYYNKSLDFSESIDDKRRASIALINISNVYQNQGFYNKSIEKLNESIKLIQLVKQTKDSTKVLQQEKIAKINLANAYQKSKDYKESKNIYNDLLMDLDTLKDNYIYNHVLAGLGKVYFSEGNTVQAEKYMVKAFKNYEKNNFEEDKYQSMLDLIDVYKENEKTGKALDLFYEFNGIKDSLFSIDRDKNLAEMLQKYEAEKRNKEIAQQQLIIERKNKQKNRILFGLIATGVFLIGMLLFFRKRIQYKNKIALQNQAIQKQQITDLQQKNKLLAMTSMIEGQEAERLRIAKDLHDSLGGLLSTVKAHFTTIQNEIKQLEELNLTDKTNHLIDEACIEVRRISHNMMPHALSISGLQGAIEDLGVYLKDQGYKTTVEITNLPKIESTKEVMIYRLVQEIISNIRKHADAKEILIQLLGNDKEVNLIVEDDGKGFDYEKAIEKGGLGLKSINSRVQFLDGTIDWDTQSGRGSSVTINIPVK